MGQKKIPIAIGQIPNGMTAEFPGMMILNIPLMRGDEQCEVSFQFKPGELPTIEVIRMLINTVSQDIKDGKFNDQDLEGFVPMSLVEFQRALNNYNEIAEQVVDTGETVQ